MPLAYPGFCGAFNSTQKTAAANTVFTQIIPPSPLGSSSPPIQYGPLQPGNFGASASTANQLAYTPNWNRGGAFTHITDLIYTSLTTAHSLYVMRPLNYTYQVSDMTSSSTTMSLAADPGTWATAGVYKYGDGVTVPGTANNTITANDFVAYQTNDGVWRTDTVASGSGTAPVLTTGIPAVTGCKLLAGSPVFWFGIQSDTDPGTGLPQPLVDSVVNTRQIMSAYGVGLYNNLHRGDPMIFYSSNGTNAGILEVLAGFYSNIG